MAEGFKIAEAYVDIKAKMDGKQFERDVKAGINSGNLNQIGQEAGKAISDGFKSQLDPGMKDAVDRASDHAARGGENSKNKFIGGFSGVASGIGEIGKKVGTFFAEMFDMKSPMIALAALGVAIAALPVIGAAAATLVVLAFGSAFAAIGMAAALHNDVVQASFNDLWSHISSKAGDIAQPFEEVWLQISDTARHTFDAFAPQLSQAFKSMTPHLNGFVIGFGDAFKALIPAIGPVTAAFNVLLDRLAERLPTLFGALSDAIIRVSDSLRENPAAVDLVIDVLENVITVIGETIAVLTSMAGWIKENEFAIGLFINILKQAIDPMTIYNEYVNKANDGDKLWADAKAQIIARTQEEADKIQVAIDAINEYVVSLDKLAKQNLTNDQAALAFDKSVLKLTESVRLNGTTLDTHTKDGQLNKEALLNMADAANKAKDKFIENGMASDEVRRKSGEMRQEMINTATNGFGFTRGEAQKLIDKYFAVPKEVKTNVSAPGADDARNKAQAVRDAVHNIPGSKSVTIFVKTELQDDLSREALRQAGGMADGGILSFANGTENHLAQIAPPGAMRIWAEPETGGEAYIPLAPSKRPRSEAILGSVAQRFGLQLAKPMADGGVLTAAAGGGGGGRGGNSVGSLSVTINVKGVWDFNDPSRAREIANYVAPAIREAIRVDERRYM